jgi:hypothetical protein
LSSYFLDHGRPQRSPFFKIILHVVKKIVVPTVNPKQLSIACESLDNHGDGRSRRVDEDVTTLAPTDPDAQISGIRFRVAVDLPSSECA